MYININLLESRGVQPVMVLGLQMIKQNKTEELSTNIAEWFDILTEDEKSWLEDHTYYIKGKPYEGQFEKIRLTDKGVKFLDDVQIAQVQEWHIVLADWVATMYKSQDKKVGNKKRLATGLAQFGAETSIIKNDLALLWREFLSDDEQMEYSHVAENVIFSSKSIYSRKFNLEECRLQTYYRQRKNYFDNKFEENRKREEKNGIKKIN